MDLKINKYEFKNITNTDWILDNGSCYQCMTLTHIETSGRPYYIPRSYPTIMSKKQFATLLKQGLVVRYETMENSPKFKKMYSYANCKAWRFNIDEIAKEFTGEKSNEDT